MRRSPSVCARVAAIGVDRKRALQALAQGVLAGPAALYLFAFTIQSHRRRARRGVPAPVPALTHSRQAGCCSGEAPTMLQAAGLVALLCGFIWRSGITQGR